MLVVFVVAAAGGDGTARADGQVLRCQGDSVRGLFTLTLATFPLVPEADAVDEQSAKRMGRGDVLVLLIGYGRGDVSNPSFQTHPHLPLTVQAMSVYSLFEHMPHGHRIARKTFVARGSAYDVQVQFGRTITPELRKRANSVLGLFHFSPPPRQTPSGMTRC